MTNAFAVQEIIFDSAGEPVDYRFLTANSAFEKHTGLKVEDVIGRTVREVVPRFGGCLDPTIWSGCAQRRIAAL